MRSAPTKKSDESLTFLHVFEAEHMGPINQPDGGAGPILNLYSTQTFSCMINMMDSTLIQTQTFEQDLVVVPRYYWSREEVSLLLLVLLH